MPKEINEVLKEWRRPPTYLRLHCHSLGPGCHRFSPGWFRQLPQWFPWVHSNFSPRKFIPDIAEAFSGHLKSTTWPIALPTKTSSTVSRCPWLKSEFLNVGYRTLCDPALGQRKIRWEVLWHPCDRCGKKDRKGWHERCLGSKHHLGSDPGCAALVCAPWASVSPVVADDTGDLKGPFQRLSGKRTS